MSSFTTPLEYELYGYDGKKKRKIFRITKEFEYRIGDFDSPFGVITVPVGFLTDFASVPWFLTRWFKPDGPWAKAAVIHDYMLVRIDSTKMTHTRVVADSIFYEAMLVSNVGPILSYLFYMMVRTWSILSLPVRIYK